MSETRIYVNSYMMRNSGHDTDFEVNLGAQYTFDDIQLDSCILENLFLNFYESWDKDFREIGVEIAGTTYLYSINQHVNFQQLIVWFNRQPDLLAAGITAREIVVAINDGQRVLHVQFLQNGLVVNSALVGAAWDKMGFELGVIKQRHDAINTYDLAQSPAILVQFGNIPNVMRSGYGQYSFLIANPGVFGTRIMYQNTHENSCQRVKLPYRVSVDKLSIKLLNCDLKPLETVASNGQKNKQNTESIFVFTLRQTD